MTAEHLRQSDIVLSRCGRPVSRDPRLSVVAIPKKFKCWAVFAATPASIVNTVPTAITGDTTFMLRAISSYVTVPVGLSLQIQFPDGRFLFHTLADIRSIAGWGSWRFPLTHERACPPGSKVVVTFTDTAYGTAQGFPVLLEGSYFYRVKGGDGGGALPRDLSSSQMRYRPGDPNQNIMAPSWMWGQGISAPSGFVDEPGGFVRSSEIIPIDVGAATTKNATALIQVDRGPDYPITKFWFNVYADPTVTAFDCLVRARDTSGYHLMDDYIQYSILNGVPLAKPWLVKGGDSVIVDLVLADFAGTGNVYVQVFAAGAKRRVA